MNDIIQNFLKIRDELHHGNLHPTIIAVSKTFPLEYIRPLIDCGHKVFGENKVQEAKIKWGSIKKEIKDLELHLIGGLQSNKAKEAVELFDYIHSVDSVKLANELSKAEEKLQIKRKYFVQVNVGKESQKSGVAMEELSDLLKVCVNEKKLEIVGLMCIPPFDTDPIPFFKLLKKLNTEHHLPKMSMGMSGDYVDAAELGATHIRVGSKIFGVRTSL